MGHLTDQEFLVHFLSAPPVVGARSAPHRPLFGGLPYRLFLLGDDHVKIAGHLIAELALEVIGAEGLDGFLLDDFALGHIQAVLGLEALGDLLGGDGAEEAPPEPDLA